MESSDTDDDSDANTDDTDIGDNGRDSAEPRKSGGKRSDEDDDNLTIFVSEEREDVDELEYKEYGVDEDNENIGDES